MESIYQLTRSQICGNMYRAADNRQESTSSEPGICVELDCDGAGAGEGAGDGEAEIVTITIDIITTRIRAAVALGGGSNIDLHPVPATITNWQPLILNIETFECEGDWLSISWLQLPSLQQSIQSQGKQCSHQDHNAITWS